MKIKSGLTLLILSISASVLSAQPRVINYAKVSNCIFNNYHPDSTALSKFCRIGCVFIKFNINHQGEISNLSFSGDSDSTGFIVDALTKAVHYLKQDTSLINNLKQSQRTIIQPFIYDYKAGCNFPKASLSGTAQDRANFLDSYMKVQWNMDRAFDSLLNLLNFNNGKLYVVDCILLSYIRVGSGGME